MNRHGNSAMHVESITLAAYDNGFHNGVTRVTLFELGPMVIISPLARGRIGEGAAPWLTIQNTGSAASAKQKIPHKRLLAHQLHHVFHMQGVGEHIHRLHGIEVITMRRQIGQIAR